jgi:predicted MFS family arabinose efflux permease
VSFLLAHMPGVIDLCGLPSQITGFWLGVLGLGNVAGSVLAGFAVQRFAMARMLFAVYALRAAGVALFVLAPKSQPVMFGFAVWMGLTYMATVPPTSGLVGKLFGVRHLGSTFGVVMLVHQLGSFFGVWLGGVAIAVTGSYDWMWRLDIALALVAALLHLPIRESDAGARPAAGVRLTGQPA